MLRVKSQKKISDMICMERKTKKPPLREERVSKQKLIRKYYRKKKGMHEGGRLIETMSQEREKVSYNRGCCWLLMNVSMAMRAKE
jgi:hypothetical protein